MTETSKYKKVQGIEFHIEAGKLSLSDFKKTHKHLNIDLDKAHKSLQFKPSQEKDNK